MEFLPFKRAIAAQWQRMQATGQMFVTGGPDHDEEARAAERDKLYDLYLASFPAGTDPIYKTRTEHSCACCRNFIRNVGFTVAIVDGELQSVWDIDPETEDVETGYYLVAKAMSKYVKSFDPVNSFLHPSKTAGTDTSKGLDANKLVVWQHFFVNIDRKFVLDEDKIPTELSKRRGKREVLHRSLEELSPECIETALELIADKNLYKGEEWEPALREFQALQSKFHELPTERGREYFSWYKAEGLDPAVARMRAHSLGTLLQDLTKGLPLDDAMKKYLVVVDPQNFHRPKPFVTPKQLEAAKKTLEEMGLSSAMERRYARISDITVNNLLWVDRTASKKLKGGSPFDDIEATSAPKLPKLDNISEVGIDDFLANVVPTAKSIDVLLENAHEANLMTLLCPVDATAERLFKWDNGFSWDYNGGATDAVKERVKARGGAVEGDLCCRLAWEYADDLDFHMHEPDESHIYYGQRRSHNGGYLDIDANGMDGQIEHPVENIAYADKNRMKEGVYTLVVNNFNRRSSGIGFTVDIEFESKKVHIAFSGVLRSNESIGVAKIKYSRVNGFEIIESMPSTETVKEVWGLKTQQFHKLNVLMASPNYWDGQEGRGHKHWFFLLDGAVQPAGKARPFYNEFLRSELKDHRKAFELVGSKLKVEPDPHQLSGLGFSSTVRNSLVCRVTGASTRMIRVIF
jgi:hypothetical protein